MDKDGQRQTGQEQTGGQPAGQQSAGRKQDFTQPRQQQAAKGKSASLDTKNLKQNAMRYGQVAQAHGYFLFILLLLAGLGVCLYLINETFAMQKQDYKQKRQLKVRHAYQLKRNKDVENKVLQSQQAGTGTIKPDYVPSRDNPFVEN